MLRLLLVAFLCSCAGHRAITGQVVDRNGAPVERAIVSLKPGGVEIVTDANGRYRIDYLRDDAGERTALQKKTDYEVEAFLAGYHITRTTLYYRTGELEVEPITLVKDTVRLTESTEDLDPAQYPDRTQSAGSAYEGE